MINSNGNLVPSSDAGLSFFNRGFSYGDALFETVKAVGNKLLFWEDHYFRLMASMRLLRMEIPMTFTPEYFVDQCVQLIQAQEVNSPAWRLRLTVFRDSGGRYTPDHNRVAFVIGCKPLSQDRFSDEVTSYTVDLYKDHYVQAGMLPNLKTNNKILNVLGSIFAKENDLDNCILVNDNKEVVEALQSNLFLLFGQEIHTPPLTSGCLDGIIRKQIIRLSKDLNLTLKETAINPFDLQKADELWLSNSIQGIRAVTNYRRKTYQSQLYPEAVALLNQMA
ncbi:MAG: aminotransferase class IV [Flavobacteriaceae bacterium]